MPYVYLLVAILAEVIATTSLKASKGFTKPGVGALVMIGYGVSFYCLSRVLETIPVGVAYAVWSGLGIVLVTVAAMIFYRQVPDVPAIAGMSLVVVGVVVMNLFSKTVVHP